MVLIITDDDQDGVYSAFYLGQKYTDAMILVTGKKVSYSLQTESVIKKIKGTVEKELIILADITPIKTIVKMIYAKLEECPKLRFIIFDHHCGYPLIYSTERVDIFFADKGHTFPIIRRVLRGNNEDYIDKKKQLEFHKRAKKLYGDVMPLEKNNYGLI